MMVREVGIPAPSSRRSVGPFQDGHSQKGPRHQDVMGAGARGYEKPERRSNCRSQELASNLWLRVVVRGQAQGKENARRQMYQRPAQDSQRRS